MRGEMDPVCERERYLFVCLFVCLVFSVIEKG